MLLLESRWTQNSQPKPNIIPFVVIARVGTKASSKIPDFGVGGYYHQPKVGHFKTVMIIGESSSD